MLDELTESLTKRERKAWQEAIDKAKKWIINAGKNGGADAPVSKTFLIKGTKDVRIDIEIITGKAFIWKHLTYSN